MSRRTTLRLGPGPEFDLIRRILENDQTRQTRGEDPRILLGPGDDCAVITGKSIAVSVDASIEDVHFRRAWISSQAMGYRATAAALSDLAAMAASPIGILATIAVPARDGAPFAETIMSGVSAAAWEYGAALLGGDTSDSPGPVMIDVVVLGEVDRPVRRAGAAPGDQVWVTGELGGAAAAVRAWNSGATPGPEARVAFERPTPRLAAARWLQEKQLLTAMIDLSDGLAGDAGHLAAASEVCIALEDAQIPVSGAARNAAANESDALLLALAGGEDYELCFASPAGAIHAVESEFTQRFGIRLTRVGIVRAGSGVIRIGQDGSERPLEVRGYSHFDNPAG
jgi:thiamine-monophosphate kinase